MSQAPNEFIAEATEILEALSRDLLVLDEQRDREVDPELLNGIFRSAHSLKGLAGMFAQEPIAQLAHGTEDLLDRLRLGKVALRSEVVDALISSLDLFHALLTEASRPEGITQELAERVGQLSPKLEQIGSAGQHVEEDPLDRLELDAQVRAVFTEYEEHRLRENLRRGVRLYRVRALYDLSDFDQRLAELNTRLKPLGEVISTLPSSEPGMGSAIAFDLIFGSRAAEEALVEKIEGSDVQVRALSTRGAITEPPTAESAKPAPRRKRKAGRTKTQEATPGPVTAPSPSDSSQTEGAGGGTLSALPAPQRPLARAENEVSLRSLTQTVRVDIRRLDTLMNTVGELLLTKANLQRMAEQAQLGALQGAGAKLWAQELTRESRQLERKLDELQKGLLDARMVPLGQVFDKLARLVRRIAREAGKELDLHISGGDVELDKLIVEELSDPLMHLIRNAIDHGIETPSERALRNKPRRANLSLHAAPQGNQVAIRIMDDGGGIDEQRIRDVALARGLLTPEEANALSRRDLQNLIFLPGFSTAKAVSTLSGRGVGLDVVKTNIGNLSGLIDVWSEPGEGTRFTLTLPVTLAILRALMVAVCGRTYAVPLNSVLEIVSVAETEIRTIERREVLNLRGQTLPFVRLARLFELPEKPRDRHFVVVVGLAQERLGIAVDELLGQQDIVTKPLGGRLSAIRGIAGATDLGALRTVLVLDVGSLLEEVILPERRRA